VTLPAHHAWTLARIVAGLPTNGELAELPEAFQPIARLLAGLPEGDDHQTRFDAFLTGRIDRVEIIGAMAAVNPKGPRPEAHEEDEPADDWGPIRYEPMPPAEPFPIEVFPETMARLVLEGAESLACPHDLIALPTLVVAGGVIGRTVSLNLKGNYFASACLWGVTVAPPGDAKSPGWELASSAVARIDRVLHGEHLELIARLEEESTKPLPEGKKRTKQSLPRPRRIDVDDITMEDVPLILADNPRGVVRLVDELTAILLGMNQFKSGKGNDRPTLLKIWSGKSLKKDRVGHESNIPVRCQHPFLAIGGGIQPDMLGSMVDASGRADGFLDRWLFAYPESSPIPEWSEQGVSDETMADWCDLVDRLWTRQLNVKEGQSVPHVAFLTPDGRAAWVAAYNAHAAEMNAPDFPPSLRGPWAKYREYAGRLALVLACVHHAADPTLDPTDVPQVGGRIVEAAWRLVAYFKTQARRVYHVIAHGPGSGGAAYKSIVEWIREGDRESFSEGGKDGIKQARRWITDEALTEAVRALIRHNIIREVVQTVPGEKRKIGRPLSRVYLVNPAFLVTRNPRNS
jgi:Protein of unknown function (DUF3987)